MIIPNLSIFIGECDEICDNHYHGTYQTSGQMGELAQFFAPVFVSGVEAMTA